MKSPIPTPGVFFESAEGAKRELSVSAGYSVATIWASWCEPCLRELRQLGQHQAELSDAGLRLIALSIDDVDEQSPTRQDAMAAIERLELPFECGFATQDTLDRLQQIQNQCLGLHTPLPLPASMVFDSRHRLVAVIRGPINASQLIDLTRPTEQPSRGRWCSEPEYDLAFMASMLLESDRLDEAIAYVQKFADQFPRGDRFALIQAQIGTRLVAAQREAEAEPFFETAVKLRPNNAEWQNDLGTARFLQGKKTLALASFQLAAKLAPENIEIQRNLASALISLGETQQVVNHLQSAVTQQPENVLLRTMYADVLRQFQRNAEALAQYRTALKLDPENMVVIKNLGATLLAKGDLAAATRLLEQGVTLAPGDAGLLKNLGLAYAVTGKREAAIEKFNASLRLQPNDASIHTNLGGLYAQQKDLKNAAQHFAKALKLQPANPRYRQNYESIQQQLRQK